MLGSRTNSNPPHWTVYGMISRGQIYYVNLSPTQGREQAGRRPVLVVSSDAINRQPLVVTVVVGTDAAHIPRDYPTNIRVAARVSGLPKDTVFLCFQLRSLEPARFLDAMTRWFRLSRISEGASRIASSTNSLGKATLRRIRACLDCFIACTSFYTTLSHF